MNRLRQIMQFLVKIEYILSLPIFFGMLALMFVQVIFRYVLQLPMVWSEELIRFMFITVSYLGCAIATHERGHIEINFVESIVNQLKIKMKHRILVFKIVNIIRDLVTTLLMGFISYYSVIYMMVLIRLNTLSTTMMIPMWIVTGIMVLGFIFSMLHSLYLLVVDIIMEGADGFDTSLGGTK